MFHPGHAWARLEGMDTVTVGEWFENVRQKLAGRGLPPALAPLYEDGGEPIRGIAKAVDPEGWDDLARELFLTK